MALSKKGAIFTVMATVMVTLLIWGFSSLSSTQDDLWKPELFRVRMVNNLVDSFIFYSENALRVSAINGFNNISMIYYKYDDPTMVDYFDDEDSFLRNFTSCIFNKAPYNNVTFSGEEFSCGQELTVPALLDKFITIIDDSLGVSISYVIYNNSFVMNQTSPYDVEVSYKINISVIDSFSNWSITNKTIISEVSLVGLRDPLIEKFRGNIQFTNGYFSVSEIKPTLIRPSDWDINSTLDFLNNNEYRISKDAPSYLMRFYGDFGSSNYGIERLVNSTWIVPGGFNNAKNNISYVDYQLFQSSSTVTFEPIIYNCDGAEPLVYSIDYFPDKFKLTGYKLYDYNISTQYWSKTC